MEGFLHNKNCEWLSGDRPLMFGEMRVCTSANLGCYGALQGCYPTLPNATGPYRALQLSPKLADVMVTFAGGYGCPFPPEHVNNHLLRST